MDTFIKPKAEITLNDLYKVVNEVVNVSTDTEKEVLLCICNFYKEQDLPLNGMKNWSKMDFNRWKNSFNSSNDLFKSLSSVRSLVMGSSLMLTTLGSSFSELLSGLSYGIPASSNSFLRY